MGTGVVMDGDGYRGLGWAHGALAVQRLGAMLAPVTFVLAGGRQVSPMHVAPWAAEPGSAHLPGILKGLRGEWPCVPFGYSVPADGSPADWAACMDASQADEEVHGHGSNHPWRWKSGQARSLHLSLDYPASSPVRRVERIVTPDPAAPAVDLECRIELRSACRLPLGLHATFRLPDRVGKARIEPGSYDHGRTFPGTVEPGAALFAIDAGFGDLSAVPLRSGGSADASRLPLPGEVEELLQLNGIDGGVALANLEEGYRVRLSWRREHFPSLLIWISNRGRQAAPWNGRHLALGLEPICSPFGLGPATAAADNPVARSGTPTARPFAAGETFVTRYRIEAEAL